MPPEPPPDGPESPPERAPRRLEVEQERPTGAYAALHPSELPMPGIPEMLPRAEAPAPGLAATASSRRLWIVASMVIAGAAVGIALLAPSRHPTPSELNAPLTVMGKDAGEVLVDGNDLGQCRPGVPLQLSLPVGRHEVRIHGTGADLVVVVQLPDDARVQYQLKDRVIHVDDQK